MKTALPITALCLALLVALPATAQECPLTATVGDFEIVADDPVYDGFSTTFGYCVTGLGGPDFRALSNWMVELDTACIRPDDLVACEPEPCYYQEDDPNLEITGIKFDEVEVDDGDTFCYSFALDGDWTGLVGETEVALKAATGVYRGTICGPVCEACESKIMARANAEGQVWLRVGLRHNRPPEVLTPLYFQVIDASGAAVHSWAEGPVRFQLGTTWIFDDLVPDLPALAPGDYEIVVRMRGMADWMERRIAFTVPAR